VTVASPILVDYYSNYMIGCQKFSGEKGGVEGQEFQLY
jgi:hypothetical protein